MIFKWCKMGFKIFFYRKTREPMQVIMFWISHPIFHLSIVMAIANALHELIIYSSDFFYVYILGRFKLCILCVQFIRTTKVTEIVLSVSERVYYVAHVLLDSTRNLLSGKYCFNFRLENNSKLYVFYVFFSVNANKVEIFVQIQNTNIHVYNTAVCTHMEYSEKRKRCFIECTERNYF